MVFVDHENPAAGFIGPFAPVVDIDNNTSNLNVLVLIFDLVTVRSQMVHFGNSENVAE